MDLLASYSESEEEEENSSNTVPNKSRKRMRDHDDMSVIVHTAKKQKLNICSKQENDEEEEENNNKNNANISQSIDKSKPSMNCGKILKQIALNKHRININSINPAPTTSNLPKPMPSQKPKPKSQIYSSNVPKNVKTFSDYNTHNESDNDNDNTPDNEHKEAFNYTHNDYRAEQVVGALGNHNQITFNICDIDKVKPPKKWRAHEHITNTFDQSNPEKKQFIMFLFIVLMAYYRIKISERYFGDINNFENLILKIVNSKAFTKRLQVSDMRSVKNIILAAVQHYDSNKEMAEKYIQKYNEAPFDHIKRATDLFVEPQRQNSLTLISLFITLGFGTVVVNSIGTISNCDLDVLEQEWDQELLKNFDKIDKPERDRSRSIVCGLSRYSGNGCDMIEISL